MPTIVQLADVSASGIAGRLADARHQEVVDEVRVRAAVAAALQERQMLGVLNRLRLREPLDRLGQQVRVVGHLARASGSRGSVSGCALVLLVWMTGSSPSTCCHSNDFLRPVGVEALAVLPGRVEQAARDLGADVGVAQS